MMENEALAKRLKQRFPKLFRTCRSVVCTSDDQADDLLLVCSLPVKGSNPRLLFGPVFFTFTLMRGVSEEEYVLPNRANLNVSLVTYNGKLLYEKSSSLSAELDLSEGDSALEILEKFETHVSEKAFFDVCSGIPNRKHLQLEAVLVETQDNENVVIRNRNCEILIGLNSLILKEEGEGPSGQTCNYCKQQRGEIDILRCLPSGIDVKSGSVEPLRSSKEESNSSGVIVIQGENITSIPMIKQKLSPFKKICINDSKIVTKKITRHERGLSTPFKNCRQSDCSDDSAKLNTSSAGRVSSFICKYCEMTFKVELDLYKHLEKCSKKPERFTCEKCKLEFRHETNLDRHRSRCRGEILTKTTSLSPQLQDSEYKAVMDEKLLLEQCPVCLRRLTKGAIFDKHIQLHIERLPNIRSPAICTKCDQSDTFQDRLQLNYHYLSRHADSEPKIPCVECLDLIHRGRIGHHLQKKHPHQPLLCPECGLPFKAPSLLNRHLRGHHNMGPHENWMCELCGNVYREKHGLRQHMRTTHSKKRDFICLDCGKGFISSQKLRQHMRIHTGAKPFGCSLCDYRCNRSYNVHAHLRKVHQVLNPDFKQDVVVFEDQLMEENLAKDEELIVKS